MPPFTLNTVYEMTDVSERDA